MEKTCSKPPSRIHVALPEIRYTKSAIINQEYDSVVGSGVKSFLDTPLYIMLSLDMKINENGGIP